MDPNTTLLRVKRKRGTDPADALLLACKRIRPETTQSSDESAPQSNETEVENSVFKLVATVATQVSGPATATWHSFSSHKLDEPEPEKLTTRQIHSC